MNDRSRLLRCLSMALLMATARITIAPAAETNTVGDAAYLRTISQRAEKIVAPLGIEGSAKSNRVHGIIVRQYGDLREIHDLRDARIKAAKSQPGAEKETIATATKTAQDEARIKLDALHSNYVAKLSTELSPEQVNTVKDGMTYGVLPLTYGVYLKMYPNLTDEQKRKIKDWLVEARELAMDGSTSDEKHAVFGKYKGKINNYLSAAGYDAKQGAENLRKSGGPPAKANQK